MAGGMNKSFVGYDDDTRKTAQEMGPEVHGNPIHGNVTHLMRVDENGKMVPRDDIPGAWDVVNAYYRFHYGYEFTKPAPSPEETDVPA